jgi:hypothetical protein
MEALPGAKIGTEYQQFRIFYKDHFIKNAAEIEWGWLLGPWEN